jgi:hypothetical protein
MGQTQSPPRRIAVCIAVSLLALAPFAAAHPDAALFDGPLRLAAGEGVSAPMDVHYHRLVATYRVESAGPVTLEVVAGADASGATAYRAALEGGGRLHHLIECCDDAAFTDYTLVIRNDGAEPARLDLHAWIVHDEFAVVSRAAEVGAVEVPGLMFLGLGIGALVATRGIRRRRRAPADGASSDNLAARRAFGWSLAMLITALVTALTLGAAGAVRYGTNVVVGLMAIMADVPVPGGLFGSRAAFLMGLLLLAWIVSVWLWIVAVRRWNGRSNGSLLALGVALAALHLAGGVAMAWAYGEWLVPVGLGLVLAVPLLVSVVGLGQDAWGESGGVRGVGTT